MLETIREYGTDRLAEETGELGDIREAHARHYLALARQADPHLRGPDQVAWQRRLHAEHANLLAALRHLGASGDTQAAYSMVVALLWFWLTRAPAAMRCWRGSSSRVGCRARPTRWTASMIDAVHGLANIMPGQPGEGDPIAVLTNVLEQIADEDLTRHPLLAAVRPMLAVAVSRERMLELLALSESHPDPWVARRRRSSRVQIYENEGDTDALRDALDDRWRPSARSGTAGAWGRRSPSSPACGSWRATWTGPRTRWSSRGR